MAESAEIVFVTLSLPDDFHFVVIETSVKDSIRDLVKLQGINSIFEFLLQQAEALEIHCLSQVLC